MSAPEDVEMNKAGFQLVGMAVKAIRQLEQGNPFAKMAVGDFRRALGYADLSEEYLDTLDPLALPLRETLGRELLELMDEHEKRDA